jgi:hypothetical protein
MITCVADISPVTGMGKYYVGKHYGKSSLKEYLGQKFRNSKNYDKSKDGLSHLYPAMRKYSNRADWRIQWVIPALQSEAAAFKWEISLIDAFRSLDPDIGYNLDAGGGGFTSEKATQVQLKRWAETSATERSRIGRLMNEARTPEQRSEFGKKARAAVKNVVHPPKGIKPPCRLAFEALSPEQRSEHVRKGWTHERRLAQSKRCLGVKHTSHKLRGSRNFTEDQIQEVQIQRSTSRHIALQYLTRKEIRRATHE